ncbi:hypothetical protein [Anaerofustis stercorihominis]|uniref:hypothetical protein n=1 Tax=Anaerofustis stercorihominis TaxID=214853 RepID=UPI003983FD6F
MKIFKTKAKLWEINKSVNRNNTLSVRMSTYEGKDRNGKTKYSNWTANFVGEAYKKGLEYIDMAKPFDVILTQAKIENVYVKEKKRAYYNVVVFDFKIDDRKEVNTNDDAGQIEQNYDESIPEGYEDMSEDVPF